MSIFQLVSILFALLMMYIVNIHRRKHSLSASEVSMWHIMWGSFILIALFPNLLLGIVDVLSFSRVFDLLVVIAMMILTTIVVISYFSQKDAAKKLEDFVRKAAIKEIQN